MVSLPRRFAGWAVNFYYWQEQRPSHRRNTLVLLTQSLTRWVACTTGWYEILAWAVSACLTGTNITDKNMLPNLFAASALLHRFLHTARRVDDQTRPKHRKNIELGISYESLRVNSISLLSIMQFFSLLRNHETWIILQNLEAIVNLFLQCRLVRNECFHIFSRLDFSLFTSAHYGTRFMIDPLLLLNNSCGNDRIMQISYEILTPESSSD